MSTLPELHAEAFGAERALYGGYRLFSVAEMPLADAKVLLERCAHGAFVTTGTTHVSGMTPHRNPETGEFGCEATLVIDCRAGNPSDWERHPLDKAWFPSYDAVRDAAYEAGLLVAMVYEDDRLSVEAVR